MTNPKDPSSEVLGNLLGLAVGIFLVRPFGLIFALNVLFGQGIRWTLVNYLAALLLAGIFAQRLALAKP